LTDQNQKYSSIDLDRCSHGQLAKLRPRILANLSKICARQGKSAEAEQLAAELQQRFPNYRPGQRSSSDYYSSQP